MKRGDNRIKKFIFSVLIFFLVLPQVLFADPGDLPGDGTGCNDPYDPACTPIDTWVVGLVIVFAIFTAIHLSRKKEPFAG
jgi:hypothetical protein